MMEAMSYIAGSELPVVVVNIMRAGPGLGGILPAQGDYFQATKGGGHGDYRCLVLAPWSVQEAANLVQDAFDLADHYRNPVLILGDGLIGQMMEPVEFASDRAPCKPLPAKTWASTGWKGDRPRAIINSLFLDPEALERHNQKLAAKYAAMVRDEVRVAEVNTKEPYEVLVVAYGTVARVVYTALEDLRAGGLTAAMVRPITLYPFPYQAVRAAGERARAVLVAELSTGQMLEDVQLAVEGRVPVHFIGRQGGMLLTPEDITAKVKELAAAEVSHA